MHQQWLAMEHHRLHSIEAWPDGPRKQAALAAIRSTLEALARDPRAGLLECGVCSSARRSATGIALAQPGAEAAQGPPMPHAGPTQKEPKAAPHLAA